jgi:sulfite reductase (ferredoxin)
MNACEQHNMAEIGFQGMSINAGKLVSSLASLLGGNLGNGNGRFSDKVIKIKPKRTGCFRLILNDFEANANGQSFLNYYDAQGEIFLQFFKPLADLTNLEADFVDWGNADNT